MKIDIQFVSLPVSETLEVFTIKKLNKLAKKYDMIINVEVFFKKENDPKGKGKICEMEDLRAELPKELKSMVYTNVMF